MTHFRFQKKKKIHQKKNIGLRKKERETPDRILPLFSLKNKKKL